MQRTTARARTPLAIVLAAGAATSLAAAPAGAATRVVEAGPSGKATQEAFARASTEANAYFRRVTTIRRGDTVRWDINGFHTVTFTPRGDPQPSLIVPDPANPVSGVTDAAGAPFWFNGQPRLILNPEAAAPLGPSTFRRSQVHNSGLPGEGPPKPYRLKFNTTGRFSYICIVHPGMRGTVRVVGRKSSVPSAAAHRRQVRREERALLRKAQRLTTGLGTTRLQNTAQAGNDTRDGVAVLKFFPANLRVATNTTVTLRMSRRSTDAHTFTFGPINGKDAYVDQLARSFVTPVPGGSGPPTLVAEPRAVYPSENPAQGLPSYDGTNHGNGFYNSGVLDSDPDTPSPSKVGLKFTKAGTYEYLCIIHPSMRGRVTVSG